MANLCRSHYPLHLAMVETSGQRVNLQRFLGAQVCTIGTNVAPLSQVVAEDTMTVTGDQREDLNEIWGRALESGERQHK